MFGQKPHALGGQVLLPTNTALAAFGDLNLEQVWQVLERAHRTSVEGHSQLPAEVRGRWFGH